VSNMRALIPLGCGCMVPLEQMLGGNHYLGGDMAWEIQKYYRCGVTQVAGCSVQESAVT
jgi:hypothetical protein